MKRQRVLYLRQTQIGEETVQALSELDQLQSLNVFGVPITPATLSALERLLHLRRIYVAQSQILPDSIQFQPLIESSCSRFACLRDRSDSKRRRITPPVLAQEHHYEHS